MDLAWGEKYANELLQVLEDNPSGQILVDLSGVSFADSCALALFAQMYQQYKDTDSELYFASVAPIVMTAMETVGLSRFLNVLDSPAQGADAKGDRVDSIATAQTSGAFGEGDALDGNFEVAPAT